MARDFVSCDRGQLLLMPPSLSEWLPENHLVWTVLGAVDQMDLDRFREAYRLGAAGRAPYDPQMLVALLLYAYARGNRSSRGIERACWEDVAFKVITGMRTPDHSTIAEFRRRHEREIEVLFDDVLGLCGGGVGVGRGDHDRWDEDQGGRVDGSEPHVSRPGQTDPARGRGDRPGRGPAARQGSPGDELPEELRTRGGSPPGAGGGEASAGGAQGAADQGVRER